jgi:hypothetical protein
VTFARVKRFVAFLHSDDIVIRSPSGIGLGVLLAAGVAIWSLLH